MRISRKKLRAHRGAGLPSIMAPFVSRFVSFQSLTLAKSGRCGISASNSHYSSADSPQPEDSSEAALPSGIHPGRVCGSRTWTRGPAVFISPAMPAMPVAWISPSATSSPMRPCMAAPPSCWLIIIRAATPGQACPTSRRRGGLRRRPGPSVALCSIISCSPVNNARACAGWGCFRDFADLSWNSC